MAGWSVYVITYLFGIATPVLIVRNILKNSEDGSSCLLDIVLFGTGALALLVAWLGLGG